MANARIVANQTGHDTTGVKSWKWSQVREAFCDPVVRLFYLAKAKTCRTERRPGMAPQVYIALLNAFLSSVPNGGLTTFESILYKSFGFSAFYFFLSLVKKHAQCRASMIVSYGQPLWRLFSTVFRAPSSACCGL